jgi:hypothetical protein
MSKNWKPKDTDRLVGKRIPESTELGKTLAQLRVSYACATEIGLPSEDLRRRIMETSLRVDAPLDLLAAAKVKMQRKRLIRERVDRALDLAMAQHGTRPSTIGIPVESLDEVREACYDYDVTFVAQ